jgi:hypothetical protein
VTARDLPSLHEWEVYAARARKLHERNPEEPLKGYKRLTWVPPASWGEPVERWTWVPAEHGIPTETTVYVGGQRVRRLLRPVHGWD